MFGQHYEFVGVYFAKLMLNLKNQLWIWKRLIVDFLDLRSVLDLVSSHISSLCRHFSEVDHIFDWAHRSVLYLWHRNVYWRSSRIYRRTLLHHAVPVYYLNNLYYLGVFFCWFSLWLVRKWFGDITFLSNFHRSCGWRHVPLASNDYGTFWEPVRWRRVSGFYSLSSWLSF